MRSVYLMIAMTAGAASCAFSQDLAQQLNARYSLMKTDANGAVTSGSVLVLQKDGLLLYSNSMPSLPQSNYQNGKISRNPLSGKSFFSDLGNAMTIPGQSVAIPQRTCAAGENLWVQKMDVRNDGVIFTLYSGIYDGVSYRGELKFPYRKNAAPPADQLLNTIAEVFAVQPATAGTDIKRPKAPAPAQAQSPADVPLPPIAPPPPPPADGAPVQPKSISAGQTPDQVIAILGQPDKVVKLGPKEIYYFKDIKVTFVDGKMTDAQ
jgi:hypothetical protein